MIIECYDIGGTKIKAALIKEGKPFQILKELNFKTETKDVSRLEKQIQEISQELRADEKIDAVSIAVPGPVTNNNILCAPPLQINKKFKIGTKFKEKVFIENDLNMAVLGELYFGEGQKTDNFYLLTLSTGIGAGIVLNKNPILGSAGEFGHNVIETDPVLANKCLCGNYGCWVAQAAGYGIGKTLEREGMNLSPKEFFNNQEIRFKSLLNQFRNYNAHGLGNMINALPVESIIVMGSLGLKQFSKIIPDKEQISRYTINKIPKIKKTKLKDRIGIIGAFAYVLDSISGK